jgi:GH15 family glucan-1,4-alpha-glucosidase
MPYLPIEDYGLIGNMQTAALVGRNGSIDWLCLPHFDSPSVFARLLDDKIGGHFRIAPENYSDLGKQFYLPDTNVLTTRFMHEDGVLEVTDYMPVGIVPCDIGFRQLVRRVEVIRGSVPVLVDFCPAFNYARSAHKMELIEGGAIFRSDQLALELTTRHPLKIQHDRGAVQAQLHLKQGERATFVLRPLDEKNLGQKVHKEHEQKLLEQTVAFWHRWLSKCTYRGRWREMVYRSALVLKLLTFAPTGALVAAPTTSLPEAIPGPRNWDYRYTWLRDASFSLYALLRLGFTEEAGAFMSWLEKRCHEREPDGGLKIMYGLRGERDVPEITLDHLDGYRGCKPVRIGNAASKQVQLDIYGELMDSVYLYNKHGAPISFDLWTQLSGVVDWVCNNWRQPDDGIWETRGGKQQFVYSKVMCWVALDRALRLAEKRSFPHDRGRWLHVRDEIYLDVMTHGWNAELNSFVQHYGGTALDASSLMMPLVFFIAPNDPRMIGTLDAICRAPAKGGLRSDSLVYRYQRSQFSDGLQSDEGTFNMCTFWLVEALTRAGITDHPRLDQARLTFEKMTSFSNHLGLYSEETGSKGEHLGNYPQAFTHLGLISSAHNLDLILGRQSL